MDVRFIVLVTALVAVLLVVVYETISYFGPPWKLGFSGTPNYPGLEFQPRPDEAGSTLVWFQPGSRGNWKPWVEKLERSLEPYRQIEESVMLCTWDQPPRKNKVCYFDLQAMGPACTNERNFGYDRGQPCILLKMNKIFDWLPEPISSTNIPDDMPKYLQESVKAFRADQTMVWVSCDGETPVDRENVGSITYWPSAGFPTYFFPYKGTPGYHSPLVFVQFMKPATGVLMNVECKAWARNIVHNHTERRGIVHFELLLDE